MDRMGIVRDVSEYIDMWAGEYLHADILNNIFQNKNLSNLPVLYPDDCQYLAPCIPKQIISIGLNYKKHARVANLKVPAEPIISSKSIGSLCGAYDGLMIPDNAEKVDWEVELGVVIGQETHLLASPADALKAICGYCTANDVSDRQWLLEREGEWIKGKSFPTFCPLGPYLVTKDEINNVQKLQLTCRVNGVVMQKASTSDMIFDVNFLVYYVSQFMRLFPGDVILTGSPEGISLGQPEVPFLREGDIIETSVSGLGQQKQVCQRLDR